MITVTSQSVIKRPVQLPVAPRVEWEGPGSWFALYVKPRHEFLVRDALSRNGTEVFLPCVTEPRLWKDRKKLIAFPLFPGYLFVHLVPLPERFMDVLKTSGVLRILSTIAGHPTPVPVTEIRSLRLLLDSDKELDVHPELRPGRAIVIKGGPLAGVEGIISRKAGGMLLYVNLTMLGRSLSIRIPSQEVELI